MGRTEEPDFTAGRSRDDDAPARLAEERLRLEREALAVERERLAAARAHAAAEARLTRAPHPVFVGVSVALLALLCFAGGLLTGIAVMENRQQRQREERLARALSQLEGRGGRDDECARAVRWRRRFPADGRPSQCFRRGDPVNNRLGELKVEDVWAVHHGLCGVGGAGS